MNRLSIAIPTYNRAAKLRRTLEVLADSQARSTSVTVLDNASSDETPAVKKEFESRMPRLRWVRHSRNIGSVGNFLRAYECCTAPYGWIVADDDVFDAAGLNMFIDSLGSESTDIFLVGSPGLQQWEFGWSGTVRELIRRGGQFFWTGTFLTGLVFSSRFISSDVLYRCYRNGGALWPYMPIIEAIVEADATLKVLERPVVTRQEPDDYSGMRKDWLYEWIVACDGIKDPSLRKVALSHFNTRNRVATWSDYRHILAGAVRGRIGPKQLRKMGACLVGCNDLLGCLAVLLSLIPRSMLRLASSCVPVKGGGSASIIEGGDPFRL